MSSLLDHLDSNQSENDDIHLLFPKCKPRASSVGTESQSSESQSNSQQYLADNFRDQNLNHPSSGGGSRTSSRRHSSGFTHQQQQHHHHHNNHQQQQQHQQHHQQLPDNLLKHSKHSSYPPLLTTASSPTSTSTNNSSTTTFIGGLSPYDNNNLAHEQIIGTSTTTTNNKSSDTRSSSHHHHQSRSQNHHHNHQTTTTHHNNLQSDSSDNFALTPSFSSNNYIGNNSGGGSSGQSKKVEGHHHNNHHAHHHNNTHHHNSHHSSSGNNSSSIKTHHHSSHSRSKNSISSRNSRHEIASALPSGGGGSGGGGGSSSINCQNQSSTRHHHHHHNRSSHHSTSDRPHRSKKLHMTESSSCEPISPAVNKSSSRYKSQKTSVESGPTKSYSTLSLGSGMECDHLDDRYEDGFCRRTNNLTSNGASYGEHSRGGSNIPGNNGGCLRDSRIEIAGGREIYSQNRIRAGRRLRGSSSTSSSTEMMADSSMSITASSSSSAGVIKSRRKSPNVQVQQQQQQQHHHHHQQQQQQEQVPSQRHSLLCTNGDDGSEHSVWEPKHSGVSKSYQENNTTVVGVVGSSRSHHSSSHRHHGSQHHHHHHHQSHARSRHICGFPHCDHAKVLSPTDLSSPACGSGSYKSSGPALAASSHNNSSSSTNNTPMTVKETVFSTEITSIEKPIEQPENSKRQNSSTSMQPPYVYETNVTEPGGEIIFDDIGNWGRNGGGAGGNSGNSGGAEAGLCIERPRKENMKRSPSGRNNARPAQLNFFHSVMSENDGGIHCCGEQMNHSGSGMMKDNTPTVLLQRSPSPSTRGGNTTPSGYESDEYSGVTPVSLNNMMGCSSSKACLTNNRLIGAVPIAEYEGSPKRYGLRQPTHPMPTHLDLVDVDMQMDGGSGGVGGRSNSEMNSSSSTHHVSISLMSPSQSKLPAVPTTATSSSSSSLDNTNSNASSTSSHRNLYGSRISPRVLSPSQSVSNFPARVPGFPQRITPVTSSLDSSSLVDSGLEKSEATDTKGDNLLDGDIGTSQSSGNNDECLQDHHHHHHNHQLQHHHHNQSNTPPQTHIHQDNSHMILSTDNETELQSASGMLCQGQLITSDHSSDLLLTDQLNNMKPEKSNPSGNSNLSLDGSDNYHHQLQQHQHHSHHSLVLDLDERVMVGEEDHHQSHSQQQNIHLPCGGEDGTTHNIGDTIIDDQCLISVPSSSDVVVQLGGGGDVMSSVDGHNLLGAATSSEYLYEFSETRKVLEEFFGSAAATGIGGSGGLGMMSIGGASSVATNSATGVVVGLDDNTMTLQGPFDELDYTLRRQAGNSYVGQRLAGDSCTVEESPKKPARRGVLLIGSSDGDGGEGEASPRLISFQEITLPQIQHQQQQKSAQNPPRDLNDNDIDGDTSSTNTETDNLGDTEVGLQVGLSRNFTLSPETTDCDSNELESEISLDYEASLHSSSRVGVSMPAVEDGLSSGNVSDTEDTVPSSDQLNNDLKRTQQSLLCSNTNTGSNNSSNGRQLSSIGIQKVREQQQNVPSGQLIEDGLGRNGSCGVGTQQQQQQQQLGLLSSSSTCSIVTANATACSSVSLPVQQSSQTSPGNSSSSSSTKIPSDPNPTLLLMKKQISEIEKEIKMRASQQSQKMQHSVDNGSGAPSTTTANSSNCSHNPAMAATPDEGGVASIGVGGPNISNGNSCVTTNGNGPSGGLASQLNVSSCPDVSTLSSSGQGSTSCYPVPSSGVTTTNTNNNSSHHRTTTGDSTTTTLPLVSNNSSLQNSVSPSDKGQETTNFDSIDIELEALDPMRPTPPPSPAPSSLCQPQPSSGVAPGCATTRSSGTTSSSSSGGTKAATAAVPINIPTVAGSAAGGRIPESTSVISPDSSSSSSSVAAAIQDIKEAIQRTKTLPRQQPPSTSSSSHVETSRPSPLVSSSQSHADAHNSDTSPVWVPRQGASSYHHHRSGGGVKDPLLRKQRYDETPDDDADTDQETDRLLGQTRTEDDYGFYDEKEWKKVKNCRSLLPALNKGVSFVKSAASGSSQPLGLSTSASSLNTGAGSNSSNNHGVSYPSSNNTIAPSSARISPAPFKQQEPLPSSQLNSSSSNNSNNISNKPKKEKDGIKKKRSKEDFKNPSVLIEGVLFRARYLGSTQLVCEGQPTKATRMLQAEEAVSRIKTQVDQSDLSSETEPLGTHNISDSGEPSMHNDKGEQVGSQPQFEDYLYAEDDDSGEDSCAESEFFHKGSHHIQSPTARSFQGPCFGGTSPGEPGTLAPSNHFGPACGSALPGTMFRLKFIGSLEVDEESGSGKRRRKRPKKTMVEEAVMKMKAPEGETQPSTEVDLFISTEKIMVLNTDLKEIMMDHALRTISYIADIGDLVVLMARRRPVPSDTPEDSKLARPPKMICHVFESDEAQYIAQSIGQAFQVAYMEFLKANGIEDQSFVREMDYQEVLNSQEIFGDELQMFAKKELQKEVVVPKSKGEILGVVIVESGWGSMLPTVVIANLAPAGAAARCGQLNIGDQIIAINGVSLVGLPLSTCQNYIKNTKSQTVVKLTVVPCPPVVEVKIKRPDTKYQLGFSVQNGVICSLLRGGIAERGGVRVGHRIIEINGQSVVAVPHEKIVNLLATSVGEINMKTMPTSMFRLLTGQETPLYI